VVPIFFSIFLQVFDCRFEVVGENSSGWLSQEQLVLGTREIVHEMVANVSERSLVKTIVEYPTDDRKNCILVCICIDQNVACPLCKPRNRRIQSVISSIVGDADKFVTR
jgi:hypothetical protein